jgi:hypothetical protein
LIANSRIAEIELLLLAGNSQRSVARITGVSRGVVRAVFYGHRRRPDADNALLGGQGPVARCRTCGALATMPCIACRDRNGLKKTTRKFLGQSDDLQLDLELKPDHQARYDEVRAAKTKRDRDYEAGPTLAAFCLSDAFIDAEETDPADRAA